MQSYFPYLTYGTLSVREVYQHARVRQEELKVMKVKTKPETYIRAQWRSALRSFSGRLRWHCHFMQKLEDEPEMEFQNLFRACDGLREKDWDAVKFRA